MPLVDRCVVLRGDHIVIAPVLLRLRDLRWIDRLAGQQAVGNGQVNAIIGWQHDVEMSCQISVDTRSWPDLRNEDRLGKEGPAGEDVCRGQQNNGEDQCRGSEGAAGFHWASFRSTA